MLAGYFVYVKFLCSSVVKAILTMVALIENVITAYSEDKCS